MIISRQRSQNCNPNFQNPSRHKFNSENIIALPSLRHNKMSSEEEDNGDRITIDDPVKPFKEYGFLNGYPDDTMPGKPPEHQSIFKIIREATTGMPLKHAQATYAYMYNIVERVYGEEKTQLRRTRQLEKMSTYTLMPFWKSTERIKLVLIAIPIAKRSSHDTSSLTSCIERSKMGRAFKHGLGMLYKLS